MTVVGDEIIYEDPEWKADISVGQVASR